MVGMLYSLIALGFVLIYKASDAINIAQGELVMFAGYIVVAALDSLHAPLFVAVIIGVVGMATLGIVVERGMLQASYRSACYCGHCCHGRLILHPAWPSAHTLGRHDKGLGTAH